MRRYLVITIAGLLFAAGCATSSDVAWLESRIEELDSRNQKLEKQVGQLKSRLEGRQQDEKKLRELFAGQDAEFYRLKTDVRELSGRFEEVEHRFGRRLEDISEALDSNREKFASLKDSVEANSRQLSNLSEYMGLESGQKPPESGEAAEGKAASDMPEDKLYAFAKKSFDQASYETAREAFEKFIETYPDSDKADNARFWIGEVYFREEWFEKAILEYQKVLDEYPEGNKAAAAYLKQGIAFQELGETGNAKLVLKELIRKFPVSNEAKIAREKLNRMGN